MTQRVQELYKQIRDAEKELAEIRSICKHENTFEGNWSWRPGNIQPATICSDCGQCVKMHGIVSSEVVYTTGDKLHYDGSK